MPQHITNKGTADNEEQVGKYVLKPVGVHCCSRYCWPHNSIMRGSRTTVNVHIIPLLYTVYRFPPWSTSPIWTFCYSKHNRLYQSLAVHCAHMSDYIQYPLW